MPAGHPGRKVARLPQRSLLPCFLDVPGNAEARCEARAPYLAAALTRSGYQPVNFTAPTSANTMTVTPTPCGIPGT